jgi:UDP-N-acetylglucosamine--N-acetylmuramyl-(pentapeptide) pyrophosphoryl-undecaprenol N-acetylglucosamine transferase
MEHSTQAIQEQKVVVLAAGGTGGHIFPAQALAEALQNIGYRPVLITDKRTRQYPTSFDNQNVIHISCRSLNGGPLSKMIAFYQNVAGYIQVRRTLKALKPVAVVGFGGYPSFPTMFAAVHMGLNTLLHEQNSVLGRVNRILAPKVKVIATAFEEVERLNPRDRSKLHYVGNPVRKEIQALLTFPYPDFEDEEHFHLLITGGSQGARIFAQIVPEAIALLPGEWRKRLRVDHQCPQAELERVKAVYEKAEVDVDLAPFFNDIAARLASSHLVIARAGAGTVSELAIAGKPSILIPLKTAMDNHQFSNAAVLSEQGAAIRIPETELTAVELAKVLETLLSSKKSLQAMSAKAKAYAKADATEILLALVTTENKNI